jgi:hypothetical protein
VWPGDRQEAGDPGGAAEDAAKHDPVRPAAPHCHRDQDREQQITYQQRLDQRQVAEVQGDDLKDVPGDVQPDRGQPLWTCRQIQQQARRQRARWGTCLVLRCSSTDDTPKRTAAASVTTTAMRENIGLGRLHSWHVWRPAVTTR